jgi:hypothetical protein
MFLRKLKNPSGCISVQIISKAGGKYKVIKTIGTTYQEQELQRLIYLANQEIEPPIRIHPLHTAFFA